MKYQVIWIWFEDSTIVGFEEIEEQALGLEDWVIGLCLPSKWDPRIWSLREFQDVKKLQNLKFISVEKQNVQVWSKTQL